MWALSGFTFEITSRTTKTITLNAQSEPNAEPITVTVTQTDYVIDNIHYATCDEAVQVLSPTHTTNEEE